MDSVFDFCGVEIDRDTGAVRVDKYVTLHDAGKLLNPLLAEGRVLGAFGWGIGCALLEQFVYSPDGSFMSGTFADSLSNCLRSAAPGHPAYGEPVAIYPARRQGHRRRQLYEHAGLHRQCGRRCSRCEGRQAAAHAGAGQGTHGAYRKAAERQVCGSCAGREREPHRRQSAHWHWFADRRRGCRTRLARASRSRHACAHYSRLSPTRRVGPNDYRAEVSLGVGVIKGRFTASVKLSDLNPPHSAVLSGSLSGPLGVSVGSGQVRLSPTGEGTKIEYDYTVEISGTAAAVGGRMLDGATKILIKQFFQRLVAEMQGGPGARPALPWWRRLLQALGF